MALLQYFNDARSLYESNGLIGETILLKLELADEMLEEENMGQDLSSKYQEEIKPLDGRRNYGAGKGSYMDRVSAPRVGD